MKLYIQTLEDKEVVDITETLNATLKEKGWKDGLLYIFVKHTTCSITTADLDPGTDKDYLFAIDKMFPEGIYNHPHNPGHVGSHIMSSIIGPGVTVPVSEGELDLGTWQRVVLIELSGPKNRNIKLRFLSYSS